MRQKLNLTAAAVTAGLILYLSVIPYRGTGGGSSLGLVKHVIAYFVLSATLMAYLHDRGRGPIAAILIATAFGVSLEIAQNFLPTRNFAVTDIAANAAGASLILLDHRSAILARILNIEDVLIEVLLRRPFNIGTDT